MNTQVVSELGVEAGGQDTSLTDHHHVLAHSGEGPAFPPGPGDCGRTDEDGVEGAVQALDIQVRLEGLALASEGVAVHLRLEEPQEPRVRPFDLVTSLLA